jgi:hypothetical protein
MGPKGAKAMPKAPDERAQGIMRAAEVALAQFKAEDRHPPIEAELRRAVALAKQGGYASDRVEDVRHRMLDSPELLAVLKSTYPSGVGPVPFTFRGALC